MYQASVPVFRHYLARVAEMAEKAVPEALNARIADSFPAGQRIVEAGRIEFQNSQTVLLDQKRVYETGLGSFWQGTWLAVAGYPKTDLSKITIVSTVRANEAFDTKLEEAIQLR